MSLGERLALHRQIKQIEIVERLKERIKQSNELIPELPFGGLEMQFEDALERELEKILGDKK